jgi:hypothetical protein
MNKGQKKMFKKIQAKTQFKNNNSLVNNYTIPCLCPTYLYILLTTKCTTTKQKIEKTQLKRKEKKKMHTHT